MTERRIVVATRTAAVVGLVLALGGTTVSLVSGHIDDWWSGHNGVATAITVGLCIIAWVVIPRQPCNASVWSIAIAPLGAAVVVASAIAPFLTDAETHSLLYPDYVPAEHPVPVAILFMVAEPITTIGVFVPVTFGLLLFPTGSLPSHRWRWVAWWTAASLAAVVALYPIASRPSAARSPEGWAPLGAAQFVLLLSMFIAVLAVLVRFGASSGDEHQQCKWVLWGGAVAAVSLGLGMAFAGSRADTIAPIIVFAGFVALTSSYVVAMVRYRLYDVDVVISQTIVYVSLAVIITGAYVGTVVGLGRLLGAGDEPDTALAIVTTAAVAAAFQPMRRRLQRLADRMVYGRRVTPHDVLSEFARRVSANSDQLLDLVARVLVDGTGAVQAEIWVWIDGDPVRAVAWPTVDEIVAVERRTTVPIAHRGVELGQLVLFAGAGQRLSEQDRMLAEQVAAGMGLALRNRTLTDTLERRVVELRESRRRVLRLQDETRRRLERDLHDGAQQQLVALRVKLGLARTIAQADGARRTEATLARLAEQADRVVDDMREFARGVYPPLLEVEGLTAAMAAIARRAPLPVTVHTDGIGRYDRDIESTVNVCVTEVIANVAEHAAASRATVRLAEVGGCVRFEVCDDGKGFDIDATERGVGLTNVVDRIDALAGTLQVCSTPGAGTRVAGAIPVDGAER